jgi:hypothetical protein
MAQWGNTDDAANSALWAVAGFKTVANSTTQTAFYGNTTVSAFITNQVTGQFGVDEAEASSANGTINSVQVTFIGSGYGANAAVTVAGGGGSEFEANAQANATGRIFAVNVEDEGKDYTTAPVLTIAAPAAIVFSGNTTSVTVGNATSKGFITLGANAALLANGDQVTYLVGAGNTAIGGLANATTFFVFNANSTTIQLASSNTGPAINLSSVATSAQPGHSVTGETARAVGVLSLGKHVTHPGWVVRKVGTGGRAGRVTYETLVAMSTISTDGDDDDIFKDS